MKSWRERIFEWWELLWVSVRVAIFGCIEFVRVARRFYGPLGFWRVDLLFLRHYVLRNPYRMSDRFVRAHGSPGVPVYGETPLTSCQALAEFSRLSAEEHLVELGCGRGRGCFFFHRYTGCRVTGIEVIPEFIERASSIGAALPDDEVHFVRGDICSFDYKHADVLYFYGTTAEAPFIGALVERLRATLHPGARVVSVSYSLATFDDTNSLILVASTPIAYPWGETEAFLHVYRPARVGRQDSEASAPQIDFDVLLEESLETTEGRRGVRGRAREKAPPRRSWRSRRRQRGREPD